MMAATTTGDQGQPKSATYKSGTMATLRFRSRIKINNINPYVRVDAKRAALVKANWRKAMPVLVQVKGKPDKPWRINLMPVGDGSFYLYLHGDVRKASCTQVGDLVSVELQFDDTYKGGPAHPMPRWFGDGLDRNPEAMRGWRDLPPSRQKEILRYFSGLKSSLAQQRNVEKALHVLSGGAGRFMARDWNVDDDR